MTLSLFDRSPPGVAPASLPPPSRPRPTTVLPSTALAPSGLPSFSPELEALLRGKVWRGNALDTPLAGSVPSGFRQLDQELPGGGWPTNCLTELLTPDSGIGEIRLLVQSLHTLIRAGRQIVLLAPPCVPYPDGWAHLGIDVSRILVVRAERPADRLWAIEQSLRSAAFGALLAWVPDVRPEALRRLQLAAAGANGLSFLFRPTAAQYEPSPAPLRLLLGGVEGRTLSVQILKRRGPVQAAPLHLHLPELRTFRLRPMAMPAAASFFEGSRPHDPRPHIQRSDSLRAGHARPDALDRAALPDTATRPHSTPLA